MPKKGKLSPGGILIASTVILATSMCPAATPRVHDALQALYRFDEEQGGVIRDQSGLEPPLDLQVETPAAVRWKDSFLKVSSAARIRTPLPVSRLIESVQRSGALTVECWITPRDERQTGPARIVSISTNASERNITLGQEGDHFDVRLRTTDTSVNGLPSIAAPPGSVRSGQLTHLVYARDSTGAVRLIINGQESATGQIGGDLSNWKQDDRLLLANEMTGNRPWKGELHLVALYSRALTNEEIQQNFAAGVGPVVDYEAMLPPAVERPVDFVRDVQPILRESCFECHATGNEEGGLNLGTRARAFEGGENGPVLVPGESARSRLVHLVAGIPEDARMPPEGDRLSDEQVGILRAWIDQGAEWPPHADIADPRLERAREHWAFQPFSDLPLPRPQNNTWAKSPIDRFILAALEDADLTPAPPIASGKLLRRIKFGLVGLPPTPEEIEEFVVACKSDREVAVAALVDRLLDSVHYGERWGRHWLDIARYADSDGQEGDADRPHAFHYRDFVIRALNDDMPYDQFVRWQLAGDEYEPDSRAAVAATGFLVAGTHTVLGDTFLEEELLRNRYNELDDMVSTTGTALLGLTIGCARCHDHKYDAISSREYYRLLSAFHSGDRDEVRVNNEGPKILAFRDYGPTPATTWLFERGDFYDRNQQVNLGFVDVLMRDMTAADYLQRLNEDIRSSNSTQQRRALAEWITDVECGAGALLARVIVNRVWQHHFGGGLVPTVDDFGVRGEVPSHPELLDWLAKDLVANGWRLKRLHRLIVNSAVYQQGTDFDESKAQIDPANRLLWRRRPQRLEGEVLRDAMLSVSGTLNLQPYGPAFKPPIPREAVTARNLKSKYPDDAKDEPATRRRTVYMFHKRVVPYPLLQAFDRPDLLQSCGRRENSTVAPQALALLNDEFVRNRSADFARRLRGQVAGEDVQVINRAFLLALGREPSESERAASTAFVQAQTVKRESRDSKKADTDHQAAALTDFCQTLFGLNEFLYVD